MASLDKIWLRLRFTFFSTALSFPCSNTVLGLSLLPSWFQLQSYHPWFNVVALVSLALVLPSWFKMLQHGCPCLNVLSSHPWFESLSFRPWFQLVAHRLTCSHAALDIYYLLRHGSRRSSFRVGELCFTCSHTIIGFKSLPLGCSDTPCLVSICCPWSHFLILLPLDLIALRTPLGPILSPWFHALSFRPWCQLLRHRSRGVIGFNSAPLVSFALIPTLIFITLIRSSVSICCPWFHVLSYRRWFQLLRQGSRCHWFQ